MINATIRIYQFVVYALLHKAIVLKDISKSDALTLLETTRALPPGARRQPS